MSETKIAFTNSPNRLTLRLIMKNLRYKIFIALSILLSSLVFAQTEAERQVRTLYIEGSGYEGSSLKLKEDGSFEYHRGGCTGPISAASGTYVSNKNYIRIDPTSIEFFQKTNNTNIPTEYQKIKWGKREYLISSKQFIPFVNAINSGKLPRSDLSGLYLREGDEHYSVSGLPELPVEWQQYLLHTPVEGKVIVVKQKETKTQRPIIVLNRGSNNGLRPAMDLYAYNPARPSFSGYLSIVSVTSETAEAIVTLQYRHIKIGDSFSSKNPVYGMYQKQNR